MEQQYVNGDTPVAVIVEQYPESMPVLMALGMHCLSCFAAQMESLKDACMVHGLDTDQVVQAVNTMIAETRQPETAVA